MGVCLQGLVRVKAKCLAPAQAEQDKRHCDGKLATQRFNREHLRVSSPGAGGHSPLLCGVIDMNTRDLRKFSLISRHAIAGGWAVSHFQETKRAFGLKSLLAAMFKPEITFVRYTSGYLF